jgi:uncharacterized protein YqgQ
MEVPFFEFIFLLLIVLVAVAGASVYYVVRKGQKGRRKTKRLVQSYFKEKTKEQELMNKELAKLQRLLDNRSIDKETYMRLRKVVIARHQKERAEVENLIDYVKKKK